MLVSLNQRPYAPNFKSEYQALRDISNLHPQVTVGVIVDTIGKIPRGQRGISAAAALHMATTAGLPPSEAAEVSKKYSHARTPHRPSATHTPHSMAHKQY